MSTKIYNGYKTQGFPDFVQLEHLRNELIKEAKNKFTELIWNAMCSTPRDHKKLSRWIWKLLISYRNELYKNKRSSLRCDFDLEFNAVFLQHDLAMVFCQHNPYKEVFMDTIPAEEYPYWNNSDEPEDVTEEEWRSRANEWLSALGEDAVPSNHGLVFNPDLLGSLIKYDQDVIKELSDRWVKEHQIKDD